MCVFCNPQLRCRCCGEFIEEATMTFTEAIEDERVVEEILAQNRVCNECKLDQIHAADKARLALYKTRGMKTTGVNN